MGGFFSRKQPQNNVNTGYSQAFMQAAELMRAGQPKEAQELMRRQVAAVEKQSGANSHATAKAYNELGTVLLVNGNQAGAVTAYRQACSVPAPEKSQHQLDRLTWEVNLAQLLTEDGGLAEAERLLRQNCRQRQACYGAGHAGYAFGLRPLAWTLWRAGKTQEARQVVEEAVDIYVDTGDGGLAEAVALGVFINPGRYLHGIPPQLLQEIVPHALELTDKAEPEAIEPGLASLLAAAEPQGLDVIALRSTLLNLTRATGNHDLRLQLLNAWLPRTDGEERVRVLMALALADSDAGRNPSGTYHAAVAEAEVGGDPDLLSQTLRNCGLFFMDDGSPDQGLPMLERSVRVARSREMRGKAHGAYGISLQHASRLGEAEMHLGQALHLLDPQDPESLCCRSHLQAVRDGSSCGCGDQNRTLEEHLQEHLARCLPHMAPHVKVTIQESGLQLHIDREVTEEEMEQLYSAIQLSLSS